MTTLISFMGKGIKDKNSTSHGYRTTQYQFPDQSRCETSFLGPELAANLQANRLILIGTASSSWDVLLEGYAESDDESLALYDAIEKQSVTEDFLASYGKRFSNHLGCKVECILIDFAKDEASQANLLLRLSNLLTEDEHIAIDVTHSFRHLPMLAMVAARYLYQTKHIMIDDIYYGAYEMRDVDDIAPVIKLTGMLNMLDWIDGLTRFDKDYDFSVFADLLSREGLNKEAIKNLKRAAFHERISSPKSAANYLNHTIQTLKTHDSPIFSLFKETLLKRMDWRNKPSAAERELEVAKRYLEKRDFIRATIYLLEALITKSIPEKALQEALSWDENSYGLRVEYKNNLMKNPEFKRLNYLRNALAHGDFEKVDDSIQSLLKEEDKLEKQLRIWLTELPKAVN